MNTPTSGAADLHRVIDEFEQRERGIPQAHIASALVAELRAAIAAQAISVEPAGAGYAAWPEPEVHDEGGWHITYYTATMMRDFADRTHALRASHGQAPAGATLRSMIEGMSVSVDVSTGDHDAGHRYFGTVTEVMECQGDKHGVTLLVQDAEPNFAAPTPQAAQPAPATQQAREVSDAMVLAALQMQHPAAYGQYLRHPANGPKTSIRTEAEIDTARRMIAAALAAAPQPSPTAPAAESVGRDADRIEKWSDRVQRAHPKSEPEFWPDALRVKYMADEISDLRAARAPAESVLEDAARWQMAVLVGNEVLMHPDKRSNPAAVKAYMDAVHSGLDFTGAVDAARKQGGV